MPSPFTPTATWTTTINEIDDSDAPTAANLNTPIEALANNVQYLHDASTNLQHHTYNAAGTYTLTFATDVVVRVFGCGGGGGGGAGSAGPGNNTGECMAGGSGGAAAIPCAQVYTLSAGAWDFVVGSGGTAGSDGNDSYVTPHGLTNYAMHWKGAAAGRSAAGLAVVSGSNTQYLPGGFGNGGASSYAPAAIVAAAGSVPVLPLAPGCGGAGTGYVGDPGAYAFSGNVGYCGGIPGPGGTQGTTSGSLLGGGGGGGGGAGIFMFNSRSGGIGGNGGNANGSGTSSGSNGTDAYNGTGAGGGGGGSAGAGSGGTGTPGSGGAGGCGILIVEWAEIGAHP